MCGGSEELGTTSIMLIRNQKVPRLGPVSSLTPQSRYAPSRGARHPIPLTSFLFSRRNQSQKTSWLFVLPPATVTRILAPRLARGLQGSLSTTSFRFAPDCGLFFATLLEQFPSLFLHRCRFSARGVVVFSLQRTLIELHIFIVLLIDNLVCLFTDLA